MATSKAPTLPGGIIKLTKLLDHLNKPPKLTLVKHVKRLQLTLAYQNDHWGARHFVKEDLPRIRYANPDLQIDVLKWRKEKNEHWRPELEVRFDDGQVKTVDMDAKPSSAILQELMSIAGGDRWNAHVEEATRAGIPIVAGESLNDTQTHLAAQKKRANPLPNLWEFRKANPQKEEKAELARKEMEARKARKKKGEARELEDTGMEPKAESSVVSDTTPSASLNAQATAATS